MSAELPTARTGYQARVSQLLADLASLERIAVAFSGGVDSAVLLHASRRALQGGAVGVIADSPSLPRAELADARTQAAAMGVELVVVRTDELGDERYVRNAGDRCYFCKTALFDAMAAWARREGFAHLAFGEITDDHRDDRPGARAAREFGVLAPLSRAGLSKQDVRRYAREYGLSVAEKPASACLASRIPVGTRVSRERLSRIERAERELKELGLRQLRVRDHGTRARLEVAADEIETARSRLADVRARLTREGFEEFELAVYVDPAERGRTAD